MGALFFQVYLAHMQVLEPCFSCHLQMTSSSTSPNSQWIFAFCLCLVECNSFKCSSPVIFVFPWLFFALLNFPCVPLLGQICSYVDILFHSNLWLFFKSWNLLKQPSYCMLYCSLLKSATVTQLGYRGWIRTNVPNDINLFVYPPSPWKVVLHHRGLSPLLFMKSSVGSSMSQKNQDSESWPIKQGLRVFVLTFIWGD